MVQVEGIQRASPTTLLGTLPNCHQHLSPLRDRAVTLSTPKDHRSIPELYLIFILRPTRKVLQGLSKKFSSASEPSQPTQIISGGYIPGYSSHGGQRSLGIESDSLSGIGSGFGINGDTALHYKTQEPSAAHAPSYESRRRSHPDSHPVPAYRIEGQNDEIEDTLDRRYRIQQNSFFKVGRVFSLLWHENVGRNGTLLTQRNIPVSIGRYNEKIYSSIRRMVVVKQQDKCSWCIPVSTYSGQGLSKPGVDVSKHAIIYMQGYKPITSSDEPLIPKRPLEVQPASPDQKLEPMSRLNFGKVYTVEHNVKVLHVGKIAPASMDDFRAYVKKEFDFGH
ncbi:hypothetical protein MW887_004167 [Aspergillus wentii]|nr:hypothetical protein MW887_004167 [Aspergillus wentii]